jgi:RNA polymerase sigma-B factor
MTVATLAAASAPRRRRRSGSGRADAPEAERQLLARYHRWGDLAAREELVQRFLPLARNLALRYTYADEPFDDLLQVASLGLIKAIDRFEPDCGTRFTSYATPTILGELKRHFRDKGWALRVPRDLNLDPPFRRRQ